jgi:hypothetical protein
MSHARTGQHFAVTAFALVALIAASDSTATAQATSHSTIHPSTFARVGSVDERFQSYNIEMVEVTGGRFWKPYASKTDSAPKSANQPAGLDPGLFQYRPPINLTNSRLRKLTAALGPAYLRVSGTWANTTYFQNNDDPAMATAPKGFNGVLTRAEWKGVIEFSKAVNAKLVTSFATSMGTRDTAGDWTPGEAKVWVDYTKSIGGTIAAAEFMNEPNFASGGGVPPSYDAAAFGRDVTAFHAFQKQELPGMIFLGPGAVGEGTMIVPGNMKMLSSTDMLAATGPAFDVFSYHSYGAVSSRCAMMGAAATTSPDAALSEDWLARAGLAADYYIALRDKTEPGKLIWNTETAEAACGGDRWASTFLDSFRYLNQLGSLAKRGIQVNLHNTMASSDYGLLDENNYEPRPNYWAALLWHRLMGSTVLDPGASLAPSLHLYAQCLPGKNGGVTLLAINASRDQAQVLDVASPTKRYTLTAKSLDDKTVELNGIELALGSGDVLPELKATSTRPGKVTLAPATITFLALEKAGNASCP